MPQNGPAAVLGQSQVFGYVHLPPLAHRGLHIAAKMLYYFFKKTNNRLGSFKHLATFSVILSQCNPRVMALLKYLQIQLYWSLVVCGVKWSRNKLK